MFGYFNPQYMLWVLPAFLLMAWAQMRIRSAYTRGMQTPARMSGAAAAQYILQCGGLHDVAIEETHGHLSDHYDPKARVVRLSSEVYRHATATAVGIAAHEAGHALQHAQHYAPLVFRNAAVPAAQFGMPAFMVLLFLGMMLKSMALVWLGIAAFGGVFLFQLINLPVEFDASQRAKSLLSELQVVDADGAGAVSSVLNAAAWTYVAATLESLLTLLYYIVHLGGGSRDE